MSTSTIKRTPLMLLLGFLILSCNKKEETGNNVPSQKNKIETKVQSSKEKDSKEFQLQTFGFPAEVEGCSCYFAKSREEFIRQNYLYVDDFQRYSYIQIGGELQKIPYGKTNEVLPEKDLSIHSSNDSFKIEIDGKLIDLGEVETALYQGTMKVTSNDGSVIETPIYGECGC